MRRTISLAEILNAGVSFAPQEAIAIAQQLIRSPAVDLSDGSSATSPVPSNATSRSHPSCATHPSHATRPSHATPSATQYGPPAVENVLLAADGKVSCPACEATPAVSEIGRLLQQMLPDDGIRIPGSLRYVIARALLEVDAPPFDSLSDFSDALQRYERGDRTDHVRSVLHRARAALASPFDSRSPVVDRRRMTAEIFELRRQLRESDERLYDQRCAIDALVAVAAVPPRRTRVSAVAAGVAIGITLVGAGELMQTHSGAPAALESARIATAVAAPQDTVGSTMIPAPAARHEDRGVDDEKSVDVKLETVAKEDDISRATPRPSTRSAPPTMARVSRKTTVAGPQRSERGVLDRLHLRWLRSKVVIRIDDL